jgi:hypothetical protein
MAETTIVVTIKPAGARPCHNCLELAKVLGIVFCDHQERINQARVIAELIAESIDAEAGDLGTANPVERVGFVLDSVAKLPRNVELSDNVAS